MTAAELIDAIEQSLGALAPAYVDMAKESDLYEASLFVAAVDACRQAGATLDLHPTLPGGLRFRTAPGSIWNDNYTRATATFLDGRAVEVHLGIMVVGASGVLHEADVAVIDSIEAVRCRVAGVAPRRRKLIAAIEAKHYSTAPGLGVGRAFLGLAIELGQPRTHLAFPEPGGKSTMRLLARRPCEVRDRVWHGSLNAQSLIHDIRQAVLNWHASTATTGPTGP